MQKNFVRVYKNFLEENIVHLNGKLSFDVLPRRKHRGATSTSLLEDPALRLSARWKHDTFSKEEDSWVLESELQYRSGVVGPYPYNGDYALLQLQPGEP